MAYTSITTSAQTIRMRHSEEKKARAQNWPAKLFWHVLALCLLSCDQLLPSLVSSKELDVLLAMVAALRSELDEVRIFIIFIHRNHLLCRPLALSRLGMVQASIDSVQDSAFSMVTISWMSLILIDLDEHRLRTMHDYINVNTHTDAHTHTHHDLCTIYYNIGVLKSLDIEMITDDRVHC